MSHTYWMLHGSCMFIVEGHMLNKFRLYVQTNFEILKRWYTSYFSLIAVLVHICLRKNSVMSTLHARSSNKPCSFLLFTE